MVSIGIQDPLREGADGLARTADHAYEAETAALPALRDQAELLNGPSDLIALRFGVGGVREGGVAQDARLRGAAPGGAEDGLEVVGERAGEIHRVAGKFPSDFHAERFIVGEAGEPAAAVAAEQDGVPVGGNPELDALPREELPLFGRGRVRCAWGGGIHEAVTVET